MLAGAYDCGSVSQEDEEHTKNFCAIGLPLTACSQPKPCVDPCKGSRTISARDMQYCTSGCSSSLSKSRKGQQTTEKAMAKALVYAAFALERQGTFAACLWIRK